MNAEPITDPRTGRLTTVYELARETGVGSHIIWYRYDTQGVRSMRLLAAKGAPIDLEAERRFAQEQFMRSTVGILSTHRLGDIARAKRQLAA